MLRYIVQTCVLMFCALHGYGQARINEVCSSNQTILTDQEGETPDWIELYNPNSESIDLTGFYLTDDPDQPTKWQFTSGVLVGFDHFIIYASGEDEPNSNPPHTSFKISQQGETILLFSENLELIDSLQLPYVPSDMSYGAATDGATQRAFFATPTPDATNSSATDHLVAYRPEFSMVTGIYNQPIALSISAKDAGAEIRYTLDGSEPNANAQLYSEPLQISSSAVVNARAFKDGLLPSNNAIGNYVFLEEQALPIVCLSTHPGYFFNEDTGIYVFGPNASPEFPYYGANFWSDTEVPVNVQWIDKYGRLGFEQKLGVRIHGGSISRTRPMRSLRLLADDEYGKDEIEYPLFSTKIQPKNKRFLLRNSGSDYLKTMFRDGFIHNVFISNGLHLDAVCFNPVEVYLNGEFWGIHNAREKVDRYYVQYNYGYNDDVVDMLEEQGLVMEGSFDAFNAHEALLLGLDLTDNSNFELADSLFDVLNIADYYISQTYINNLDWPYNNLKYWRARVDSSKWRYVIFDLDATLGGVSFAPVEFDALNRALGSYGDTNRHVIIFRKLLENRAYFEYFINRYCDLANTVFSAEKFAEAVDRAADRIEPVIHRHYERWNAEENDWYDEVDIVKTYVERRPPYALSQLQNFYGLADKANIHLNVYPPSAGKIDLNSISLREFPFDGVYFEDIAIRMGIDENPGFTFSHWETNRSDFDGSSAYSRTFFPADGDSVTAIFVGSGQYNELEVFPSPTSGNFTTRFVIDKRQQVQVLLYDLQGSRKAELFNGQLQGGTHQMNFNVQESLQGIYLLTVMTETQRFSEKVVFVQKD
ncbi:MAG: CotH kinase family protein [Flavobacteriales bacterium]|nr:CotH kinase family protein [Flavobacteriales bacterium]